MSIVRAVGRNTIIQFGGKIVGTAIGLLTVALLQRYMGVTGYGAYTTAMAYLGFLSVLADLGLYMMLIRELAKPDVDASRAVGNLLGLRWVSAAIILGLGVALATFFPYTTDVKHAIFIGSWSFVAVAATQLLSGIFQTKLQMGRVAGAELTGRIILLLAMLWVIKTDAGLSGAMLAVVAGSLASFVLIWVAAQRFVPLRPRFEWTYWRQMLSETWPVAISIVLNLIYFRLDTILLSLFSSQYQVGLYGAAYKVLEVLNTFPIMFVGLLLPVLGRAFEEHDRDRFRSVFQRGFELLWTAFIPIMVGGWILSEKILVAISGADFAPAAPALRLLLVAVGALFLNALSGHVVTVIHRQRQMVWTYLGVAVMGVVAYLVLIPRFDIRGAATGTILTEVATGIVGFILVLRVMQFRLQLGTLPRVILSAAIMGMMVWLFRGVNVWLVLVGAALVYMFALIATRAIKISTIKEIISSTPPGPVSPL